MKRDAQYEELQKALVERERDVSHQNNELNAMRLGIHGEQIAHAKEVRRLSDEVLKFSSQAATAVAMNAEKQKEVASLRQQITDLYATHREEIIRGEKRVEQMVDWIAKGATGLAVFEKPEPEKQETPENKPDADPNPPVKSDLREAIDLHGPRARAVVRHLNRRADEDLNPDQLAVRKMLQEDVAEAESTVELQKTT